ncbi:MAG: uridylate kinase [Hyphomicrobium sp.]|nr:uridylate kinase [Hyphomicrobium sp.]
MALVLKLGGSLYESGRLDGVLERVAAADVPVIVVPGGGPFADAVRAEYQSGRIDEATAHDLAVLAMQQMAILMARRAPVLRTVETEAQIGKAVAERSSAIWLPWRMARAAGDIARDWSMTSDGMAAWLARRLESVGLRLPVVLVKSCEIPQHASARALADSGIVDAWFARIVTESGPAWRVVSADDPNGLSDVLRRPIDGAHIAC